MQSFLAGLSPSLGPDPNPLSADGCSEHVRFTKSSSLSVFLCKTAENKLSETTQVQWGEETEAGRPLPCLTSTALNPEGRWELWRFNWQLQVGSQMPYFCLIQNQGKSKYHHKSHNRREDRITICILRQKKKIFSFSKDKHLQGKFALGNKLCDKVIYLDY